MLIPNKDTLNVEELWRPAGGWGTWQGPGSMFGRPRVNPNWVKNLGTYRQVTQIREVRPIRRRSRKNRMMYDMPQLRQNI